MIFALYVKNRYEGHHRKYGNIFNETFCTKRYDFTFKFETENDVDKSGNTIVEHSEPKHDEVRPEREQMDFVNDDKHRNKNQF